MLYQEIANELDTLIRNGHYLPNEKLPSIREIARQRQVSISTVQRVFEELELRGLVFAKPKSGYFVLNQSTSKAEISIPVLPLTPQDIHVHKLASHIFNQCDQPNVINLGTSYPAADYFPQKLIQQITTKVTRQHISTIVETHFSSGLPALKQALSKRLNHLGCNVGANDLIVTNGCLEALSLCLRAVAEPNDTIAVESPGFVGLYQLIESLGFKAIEIPCHPVDGMSLDALSLAIETCNIKAVAIVPSFSNPLGSNMPENHRKQLVEMLAEAEIPLIEDDLLGDLSFSGARLKPCKAFDQKGLVLYCSSASKTLASGLRVGWIAPGKFYKQVSYFKTFTNISAPNLTQLIVAEFLNSGKYDRFIRQFTAKLAKQMFAFQNAIEQFFPQGTKISRPQGGCILWVELPKQINGMMLFEKALKQKLPIAIIPGKLSSGSNKFDHFIRINCACDPQIPIVETIEKLSVIADKLLANQQS